MEQDVWQPKQFLFYGINIWLVFAELHVIGELLYEISAHWYHSLCFSFGYILEIICLLAHYVFHNSKVLAVLHIQHCSLRFNSM